MNKNDPPPLFKGCPFSHSTRPLDEQPAHGASRDIAALSDGEAKYAGIIDSAMDAIITVDERQGHLYQGLYKSFPVQDDKHFLTVCRYVERNPLRA